MKRLITVLLLAAILPGCLPEYRDECPEDLGLVFVLKDDYQTGTYDTRVAADVMLAVFNDRYFVRTIPITYAEIASENKYVIKKDDYLVGNVELVAWAASTVEGYDPTGIPGQGGQLGDIVVGLEPVTRAEGYYYPAQCGLYMGIATIDEKIDQASTHRIDMLHSSCRVEVNVTDHAGMLSPGDGAVNVHGSMSHMDMAMRGTGNEAIVRTSLEIDGTLASRYTTGRFGIMPSAEGQTVSVEVTQGDKVVAVLTVPNSALPTGAQAGMLIVFDYVIGDSEFFVTVDGFSHKILITDV